jgi:acyl-CoA thioester hydrolase
VDPIPIEVYTFDIDFAGHVSNISYIRWLEIGRLRLLDAAGWPVAEALARGVVPILASTEIRYRKPIKLGDRVSLEVGITELGRASATIAFTVSTADDVAATATQTGLFVDAGSRRPHRLTDAERASFVPFVTPADRPPPTR